MLTNSGKDIHTKIKKKNMQKFISVRVYFHTWKIYTQDMFWKSFYEDDIQPEKQVAPCA